MAEINSNLLITDKNAKLQPTEFTQFFIWSIPSIVTCPWATPICKDVCYAKYEEVNYINTRRRRQMNLEESKKPTFVADMINLISYMISLTKYKRKHIYFRWHESGDIYSQEYADNIIDISNYFKGLDKISFQAYTKSLPLLRKHNLEDVNIKFVFSVMADTKASMITEAQERGIQMFIALPESKIDGKCNVCTSSCANCKVCYEKGIKQNMIIPYHGVASHKKIYQ